MDEDVRSEGPPAFERPFESADTKERVYSAVLQAREPMTAAELADEADCSAESARKHLSFYVDLGVAIEHDGRPARYERNDDYFEWRRVSELAREYTLDELQSRVSELTAQIEEYRAEYDADSPAEVDVLALDTANVDDVYAALGNWATLVEQRHRHERARQKVAGSTAPTHS